MIAIRALQTDDARRLQDHPAYAVLSVQLLQISQLKAFPILQILRLREPLVRQLRKHRHRTTVFNYVSNSASMRNRTETVVILSWNRHIVRVYRKESVHWGVLPTPCKRLYPWVLRFGTGPFDMATLGKKGTLCHKHPQAERQEERNPSPRASLQDEFSKEAATQQNEDDVQQMEASHGL